MTVFIYEIKRKVHLTLRETGETMNWNLPMNNNDFRVFKDAHNTIEFVVRNTDRKPINMADRKARITFYDQRTNKGLWEKDLRVINEAKGICQLNITPDITADWFLQTYSYSVMVTNSDGTGHMLYVDQHEGQRGFFELAQGPSFDPHPSTDVTTFTPVLEGLNDETHYLFSSALPGSLQRNNTSGLHTCVAYLDNFSGTLVVQGSVEEGSPTEQEWYEVLTRTYDHHTGLDNFNFEANLNWVRFRVQNRYTVDDQVLDVNEGKVQKLVFRN